MALTRKLLESMGLESDKVSTIIEAHVETVDGLKGQIAELKEDADKLPAITKELEKASKELESFKASGGDWEKKYSELDNEFKEFKTSVEAKELMANKKTAYKELLKEAGVSANRYDTVLKVTDFDKVEILDGKIKDSDAVLEGIKAEWSDFIPNVQTQGATTIKPPSNNPDKKFTYDDIRGMSRDEINKNWGSIKDSLSNN